VGDGMMRGMSRLRMPSLFEPVAVGEGSARQPGVVAEASRKQQA
jgi:hypothetical protein